MREEEIPTAHTAQQRVPTRVLVGWQWRGYTTFSTQLWERNAHTCRYAPSTHDETIQPV